MRKRHTGRTVHKSYYLFNAHGEVVQLTDAAGAVTQTYDYDAFGNQKTDTPADANPFRYCGEYFDAETGTIYLRARYYDPAIGRMISQDTFAGNPSDPLSLNLYTYCNNNPVSYHDPSGHVPTAVVGALIGGAIGYGVNLFTQLSSNGWNWSSLDQRSLWASAGAGAVSGAMAGMTGGLSLLGSVGSGALIGGANYGTYNLLNGTDPTLEGYALSMGTGAAMSGITYGISNIKGGSNVLENANFAQKTFSNTFSPEGIKKYSELAGQPIKTIDDLVAALKSGTVSPSDLPVEYIARDGNTLILNTRTSQALTQAGIPRSQWSTINQTGNEFFEDLLTGQLSRNGLTSAGTPTVRPSGGTK
ncbi:RHS repeat-associated protein [Hydrogenoanaerobacterium saccharovorans]|uniref:RHS repeat-associated core domain-containing protein n=1 Tax=Hydrogenoanaerobacterium saccharovorans TaxID=474960 RepID=A0A1H8D000_9FIRM|nr:RHS repeat-associated core domain-containing protein [Hydrogenoanaerobacterium saccharovorans]RPF43405.1 RHS repeat-associated protein [Hydrogenoanaerobacterium saccharovorans]SEN00489.1 RHS repeat-associated core domain-containing protein [Hydrogenoanaerobacterium saccharovorans]